LFPPLEQRSASTLARRFFTNQAWESRKTFAKDPAEFAKD
jgi:hypothetical protein